MPIVGLTDNVVPMLPRVGKLRKGGEKQQGKFGADLEYFRFTSSDEKTEQAFARAYGKQPDSITVFFDCDTPDQAFETWCEVWGKSGLVHRCDGETMSVWLTGDRYVRGSKPCNKKDHKDGDPLNDAVGRLTMILPGLLQEGIVGVVTLGTHSKHDLINISKVLKSVYVHNGTLRGVTFTLRRVQEEISVPGWGDRKGQRTRTKKWLVRLEPVPQWVDVKMQLAAQASLGELPQPQVVDGDTGEVLSLPAPISTNMTLVEARELKVKGKNGTVSIKTLNDSQLSWLVENGSKEEKEAASIILAAKELEGISPEISFVDDWDLAHIKALIEHVK